MKKMRKGFTLVELLIVVAIMATLAAAMMVSFGDSTAAAKASSIASNIDSCITAAKLYLADNINNVSTTSTAKDFLNNDANSAKPSYVANWSKMSATGGTIVYAALEGEGNQGIDNWKITVTITAADMPAIVKALRKIKGYEATEDFPDPDDDKTTYTITVNLLKGTASGAAS